VVASAALVAFALSIGVSTAGPRPPRRAQAGEAEQGALQEEQLQDRLRRLLGTQPFANLVTKGLYDAAKAIAA